MHLVYIPTAPLVRRKVALRNYEGAESMYCNAAAVCEGVLQLGSGGWAKNAIC